MEKIRIPSLMAKLALSVGAVFFIVSLLLGWTAWKIRESIREQGLERMSAIVNAKSDILHEKLRSITNSVSNLSEIMIVAERHHHLFSLSQIHSPSPTFDDTIVRYLKTNHLHDVILIAPSGKIVYAHNHETYFNANLLTGPLKDTYLAQSFKNALKNMPPKISGFAYYLPSSDYAAFIAQPIIVDDQIVGVLAVQIQNDDLHIVINNYEDLGKSGEIHAAVFKDGMNVYMAPTRFGEHPAFSLEKLPSDHPLVLASMGGNGSQYYTDHSGVSIASAWTYLPDLGWGIMAKMSEDELLANWNNQSRYILMEYTLLYLMVLSLLYYLYTSIRKPLNMILEGTKSFAEGNFESSIIVDNHDELGVLADTYNMMAERICSDFSHLNEKNERLYTQKMMIEKFNNELEEQVNEKSRQLVEYVKIVDEHVITSTTNINGTIIAVSKAFCAISGYSEDELIGQYHNIVRHPDMPDLFFKTLWDTIITGHTWHGEVKNRKKDGTYYWVDTVITPNYQEGVLMGFTSIRQDITDRKRAEELAITDSLTGLFNRRHFNNIVENELNRAKRNNATLAIILLDIDYFKQYNDNYGHLAGDDVLIQVSKVLLEHSLRANDHSFRLGGEEFAILMYGMDVTNTYEIAEYIRRRIESLKIPHGFSLINQYVTVSIGVALDYGTNIKSFDAFFKTADDNLYHSKASGRNKVTFPF